MSAADTPRLQVEYRRGRAVTAYYYVPSASAERSAESRELQPGLVVDFDSAGRPIGVEILDSAHISVEAFNRLLSELHLPAVSEEDLAPLHAA